MLSLLASRLVTAATDLLFPPTCAACQADLATHHGVLLCSSCEATIRSDTLPRCPRCAMPCRTILQSSVGCSYCRELKLPFAAAAVLGNYDTSLRAVVIRAKYPHGEQLALAAGQLLADRILELAARGDSPFATIDAVVPVPMHWLKRMVRGASAAESIARGVASRLNVPLLSSAVGCTRFLAKQGSLSQRKRARNVRSAYRATGQFELTGASLLIVDDVLTTLSTTISLGKSLIAAGAAQTLVAGIARSTSIVS